MSDTAYGQVHDSHFSELQILKMAESILENRMSNQQSITSSRETRAFLRLKLAHQEREVFAVIFLDSRHKLLSYEELFFGTIDAAAVYPREVVKAALKVNSAAVILAHNHPSGYPEPSMSDRQITKQLVDALNLIDVKVLDHVVVGGIDCVSFAERGLL